MKQGTEIIEGLAGSDIKHISVKPGSGQNSSGCSYQSYSMSLPPSNISIWSENLASSRLGWSGTLPTIRGSSDVGNYIRRFLVPQPSLKTVINPEGATPTEIEISALPLTGSNAAGISAFEGRRGVALPMKSKQALQLRCTKGGRNLCTGDSSEVPITTNTVESFCKVLSNQSDAFKTARSKGMYAPVDFDIGKYTHSTLDTSSIP